MRAHVLSIEDDPTIQTLIQQSLKEYNVISVKTLQEAKVELAKFSFAAILMDIELPDGDGLRFFSQITQDPKFKHTVTLFLTGHGDIGSKLMAFSLGADDFLTKPFDSLELNARLTSKISKLKLDLEEKKIRKIEDLEIDFDRQKVFQIKNGREVDLLLTSIELKILTYLSRHPEQVYSREQILNAVWGNVNITDRTVDSHIAHLRTKLENSCIRIDTVKNFGYRLLAK